MKASRVLEIRPWSLRDGHDFCSWSRAGGSLWGGEGHGQRLQGAKCGFSAEEERRERVLRTGLAKSFKQPLTT